MTEAEIREGLDRLQPTYKAAVEDWVNVIRKAEALASCDAPSDFFSHRVFRDASAVQSATSCQHVRGKIGTSEIIEPEFSLIS